MTRAGYLLVLVHIWCCFGFANTQSNPYREVWNSKIKSLELMTHLLNDKITEGERQRIGMKSELASLKNKCDSNQTVKEIENEGIGEHAHIILQNAFQEQKLYVHQLEKDQNIALAEIEAKHAQRIDEIEAKHVQRIDAIEAKHAQRIGEIEAKHAQRIDEIEAKHAQKIDGLKMKYEQIVNEFQVKHDTLDQKLQGAHAFLEIVREDMVKQSATNQKLEAKLGTILAENARLDTIVDENAALITRMEKRRCQSGTFGDRVYPKKWNPRTHRVDFDPPFEMVPSFMYALRLLDVIGTARVNADLIRVNRNFAEVRIVTWGDSELYGAYVQWMACP